MRFAVQSAVLTTLDSCFFQVIVANNRPMVSSTGFAGAADSLRPPRYAHRVHRALRRVR
jgi:hypothetical protein